MKIGIDARLYGPAHRGIGRYIQELIHHLLTIDTRNEYVFFVSSEKDKKNILYLPFINHHRRVSFMHTPYRCYSLKEQLSMPKSIKKAKVDLMHFPHFNMPMLPSFPQVRRAPFVVTIHDLIIHHFPNERATTLSKWRYNIKLFGYQKVITYAITQSRAIIVPSEFTKKDILRFYDVDENKIKVIYEGVSDLKSKIKNQRSHHTDGQPPGEKPQLKAKNLVPYLLYVGSFYPHKNIERLIDAFVILKKKYNYDGDLLLVGKKDFFQRQVKEYAETSLLLPTIHFKGAVSDSELAELYKNAQVFVYPSLYEGFGLPPLEALQYGTPIAVSNASCLPEILGTHPHISYFNPCNTQDMANAILQSLKMKNSIPSFSHYFNKYSWKNTAQKTLQIYKKILS